MLSQMDLTKLCELLQVAPPSGADGIAAGSIEYDSRNCKPGSLFFCLPGRRDDGHEFAVAAAGAGAVAVICERPVDVSVPQILVPDARRAMNEVASAFYGHPSHKLQLAGVTGTNGKTTTAFMLGSIFEETGPFGLIGTIETRIADQRWPGVRTTPEAVDLQSTFRRMLESGVQRAVMEVTSIGLHQGRLTGTEFDVVAFTNLSRDHIEEYHGTMDDYFAAKKMLFTPSSVKRTRAVINIDDAYGRRLAREIALPVTTVGREASASVRAIDVKLGPHLSSFKATGEGLDLEIEVPIPGAFNVMNALVAAAVATIMGVAPDQIARGIGNLSGVPGRFEPIDEGQDFAVIVDYAHTPDSLQNILAAAREMAEGRVIAVFGCGGDRDRAKRPLMGRVAAEGADVAIATSDNPRSEDPKVILQQVEVGMREVLEPGAYRVVEDRRSAIAEALATARAGDVVVIAGKGHETGQELATHKIDFDDRLVARELLNSAR